MKSHYFLSNGKIERKDNTIRITKKIEGETISKSIPIKNLTEIYAFGQIDINTACLSFLAQNNIPIHFFNYFDFYIGSFYPKEKNISGKLLIKQVEHQIDSRKKQKLASLFVKGATHNILRNLNYYQRKGTNVQIQIDTIQKYIQTINETQTIEELMGIEGNIRKVYYSAWPSIIKQKTDFTTRVKNPPDNMVNSLISLLNSMLYTTCLSEIYITQLNPTISYLHVPSERRFSLSLDITEIFKPIIIDRLIFSLLNKKIITEKDFEKKSKGCYLKEQALAKVVQAFDQQLNTTIKHPTLKRNVSYKYLMRLECYKLIKHILNTQIYEPFRLTY